MGYLELSKQELEKEYGNLAKRFEEIKGMAPPLTSFFPSDFLPFQREKYFGEIPLQGA